MNKVFVKNSKESKFEMNSKTFPVGLIALGVVMMFFPQTKSLGPLAFGFGIGMVIQTLSTPKK